MNGQDVVQNIYYDDSEFMRVETAPGYALLGKWFKSDLWGINHGPYEEVRDAAVRGLKGEVADEVSGNGFSVEIEGGTTTLTLLARPERDLRMSTADLLAALDKYADASLERRPRTRTDAASDS